MDEIKIARWNLKDKMVRGEIWPGTRCACGREGATDLGHIVYSRHPDNADLYSDLNCVLLHNTCNTTEERFCTNVNACLIILQRAGGQEKWLKWAKGLPRKGKFWIPTKMRTGMLLWARGVRSFDFDAIYAYVNRPMGGRDEG